MDAIETMEHRGLTVKIYQDVDAESPRVWDNAGIMALFHKRYTLPNESKLSSDNFNGWEEMEKHIREELGGLVVLPVYMYDHSGITISTSPFSCPWDSGRIGFIYATKETILKEWGKKGSGRVTKKMLETARRVLEGEIETFDQYITGDVYGYRVEDASGNHLDSCWGFYGMEDAIGQGRDMAEYHSVELMKARAAKVKAFIKNHVPLERREEVLK